MRSIQQAPDTLTVQSLQSLGRSIRQIRKAQHLTLEDLAEQMGTYPLLLSRLEAGDARVPVGTLITALQYLGISNLLAEEDTANCA
ncbi:helix-turn-helix transcriptional regulator [Pseudovibrio exalbescens]|uniref:helix-turn-helix domain-containing protein n=1 Tax=Pseudovibrio exalbescens TaxID=197461 RepID=UPI002366256F|nr:helix-turn-helix transcriptional regulator [Pseudovibrio exalbescens]MDD7911227.1 helix-turn-helix transcriptional regulator [Pseudovibrio exalbescens]